MAAVLDIDVEDGLELACDEEELATIADRVLAEEGVERTCYLSVSVVSDERMHELNLAYRGVNAATDVLSLECERPDDEGLAEGEPAELGDVVLAPAYIARQAASFGTTAADECRLLFVHAILHLLGYDHLEEDEAEVMERREDELCALIETDGTIEHTLTRHEELMGR